MVRTKNRLQIAVAATNGSFLVSENGMIRAIVYVLPNYTTAVSGVLTLKDTEGDTIYTSGTINENATTLVSSLAVPVDYGYTATFTLNDVSGDDPVKNTYIKLYIEAV